MKTVKRKPGRPKGSINKVHGTSHERATVARRFRDFRERLHLTQQQLASLIGIKDRAGISDIERGLHLPHYSTMKRFTEYESKSDKEIRDVSKFGQDGS